VATPIFVLIHSPLVGPFTWEPVADALRRRNLGAVVPALHDRGEAVGPFWQQHALTAAAALAAVPRGRSIVLVGHSGAGPLLPAIRHLANHDVDAYIFVDAGIPLDGAGRLDLLRLELPQAAEGFQAHLEAGGRYPEWRDEALRDAIPDPDQRARLLAQLQPRAGAFWWEPIPVFAGWPDAPCIYLRLSQGYAVPAARAREDGWVYGEIESGHFHMLVDPESVTRALVDLTRATGIPVPEGSTGR